jgi:hypothetical protein
MGIGDERIFRTALFLLLIAAARVDARQPVAIRVYDTSGLEAGVLGSALTAASPLLADAGIDAVWEDCGVEDSCGRPLAVGELIVRVVKAPEQSPVTRVGEAVLDPKRNAGVFATIYADRIAALAATTAVDSAPLIGRVIAHEIGHLLLGLSSHRTTGLMRPRWRGSEIVKNDAADWTWSAADVVRIQQRLFERPITTDPLPPCPAVRAKCVHG